MSQKNPVRDGSRIYVIGSAYMDVTVHAPRSPAFDEHLWGAEVSWAPGGRGVNQAVAAARAGGRVVLVSALSNDAPARGLRDFLQSENLVLQLGSATSHPTGVALFLTAGETSFVIDAAGANLSMTPELVDRITFTQDDVLLLQNEIPFEVCLTAANKAKYYGATVLWNIAPFRKFSSDHLSLADIWILNRLEFSAFCALADRQLSLDDARRALASVTEQIENMVVTMDIDGVLAKLGKTISHIPAQKIQETDSRGAGDCFCGALAAGIANRLPMIGSLEFANNAATLAAQRDGAAGQMPYLSEIQEVMHE